MTLIETPRTVLFVIEDDPDVQFLVETIFSMDSRFTIAPVLESAEEALESAHVDDHAVMVLDHGLGGVMTGLEAAPQLKELVPQAKIILFTAYAELRTQAEAEASIDAFLLKTDSTQLLPLAQRLTGLNGKAS